MRMRLDNEDTGNVLKIVPGTQGMQVPSACTIVIIAGKRQPNYFYLEYLGNNW